MADRLDEAGMVLIPSLHDRDLCRRIAHQVHNDIMSPIGEFGNIKQNEFRKDLPLLLEGDYLEILRDALLLLQPVFEKTLGRGKLTLDKLVVYSVHQQTRPSHTHATIV